MVNVIFVSIADHSEGCISNDKTRKCSTVIAQFVNSIGTYYFNILKMEIEQIRSISPSVYKHCQSKALSILPRILHTYPKITLRHFF